MKATLAIVVAAIVAAAGAGAVAWKQTDRQLRSLQASNAELRAYVADLGEKILDVEGALHAVLLREVTTTAPSTSSVDRARLDAYVRAQAEYAACRQVEEYERQRESPNTGSSGARPRERIRGLGLPDIAHGRCNPPAFRP